MALGCPVVKWAVLFAAARVAVAGCGSGDSTVSKTPEPTISTATPATAAPAPALPPRPPVVAPSATPATAAPAPAFPPPPPVVAPSAAAAADPCAVNLAAPEIAKAVSELPRDPRSNQPWSPEPLAGNYNESAQLSAVVIK